MHKSQVFFYLLSIFILGVFVASFLKFSMSMVLIPSIIGIFVIILSGFRNTHFILVGFLVLAFVGGIARFNHFSAEGGSASGGNLKTSLIDSVGQEVVVRGYIYSEPEIDGNRSRFVFSAEGGSASGGKNKNERILITTNAFPEREFGDELSIRGELELPLNFSDFNYITYLKKDGIRMVIFYPKEIKTNSIDLKWSEKVSLAIYQGIFVVKNKFQDSVNLSIPEPNAAFINGILLGTRQNIPDDLKDAFNKTGTTHILAISGYNIMIISEGILLGLIWFFKRRIAFWISVAVIILFVILTGASASVVRAAIMGLLLSFAHGYGRLYDQKNSIILAGAVMILINPLVLVFDIGFQLSFAAVLGLIYIYPRLNYKTHEVSNWGGLKKLVLMTISAQVAVAPLLIYYFGSFSPVSLLANVLILPFVPVAMLTGFIVGLTGIFSVSLGQLVGYIAWAITTYQIGVVEFFAETL